MQKTHYQNRLLNSLSSIVKGIDLRSFECLEVHTGQLLQSASQASEWIYFPETAQLSLQIENKSSFQVEVLTIGTIGAANMFSLSLDAKPVYSSEVIRGGKVWRIPVEWLIEKAQTDKRIMRSILLYNNAITNQIALTAFCNSHHLVLQRFCRWILQIMDQTEEHSLMIALNTLQNFKNATPEERDRNIEILQAAKAIVKSEDKVVVINRREIESMSCNCHLLLSNEIKTFFSSIQNI